MGYIIRSYFGEAWWCMPLISALRRQKQADFFKFKASLVYNMSSRAARADTLKRKKNLSSKLMNKN